MKEGTEENAIHQPEKAIQKNPKGTIASPNKEVPDGGQNASLHTGVDVVIHQNNYTNLFLQSLRRQGSRIENSLKSNMILLNLEFGILEYKQHLPFLLKKRRMKRKMIVLEKPCLNQPINLRIISWKNIHLLIIAL